MLRLFPTLLAVAIAGCGYRQPSTAVISVCDLSRDFTAYRPSVVDLIGTDYTLAGEPPFKFTTDDAG